MMYKIIKIHIRSLIITIQIGGTKENEAVRKDAVDFMKKMSAENNDMNFTKMDLHYVPTDKGRGISSGVLIIRV